MTAPKTLAESFENLPDSRIEKKTIHKLIDIVIIAICAVISGAESWTEIEMLGKRKKNGCGNILNYPL